MGIKVTCSAIVIQKNKFAIVQEAKGLVKGQWNIPGGHLHENENLLNATIREVKEETGLDIKLEGIVGVYEHKSKHGNNVVAFYFKASVANGKLKHDPEEILDSKWVTFEEFLNYKDDIIRAPFLKEVVKDYLNHNSVEKRIHIFDF